jgi:hypothetical protein
LGTASGVAVQRPQTTQGLAFPMAPSDFVDFAGNIMVLKSRGVEVVFHRLFGGCIWDMLFRNQRYTQPLWGRGGSFQTAMCFGIRETNGKLDSCEMYNPTMAGSLNDEGGARNTSVVKEFKLSRDGTQAFVRTQAAYWYGAGTPVGSDPARRPPYNTKNVSGVFVSYWVRVEDPGQTLVIDVGVDVVEKPPGPGGQIEVLTNYMPNTFKDNYVLQGGKLVRGPPVMDEGATVWDKPQRLLARATADGQHCQGIVPVSRSSRGQPYLGTLLVQADPAPEKRLPDVKRHLEGRPAFDGGLSKWTVTWHERPGKDVVGGKYAWRIKMPMGTVAEVASAMASISKTQLVTF